MYNQNPPAYPVDRPLMAPQQVNPNQPPFVPNVQVSQYLQPYLPYLTGVLMNVIAGGAQGPISMCFYNHMLQGHPSQMQFNPWANEEFAREVANCADFIYLKTIATGQQVDMGQAIQALVPAYVGMRAMFELKIFGGLWAYVDQADQFGIQQQINNFELTLQQIDNLRRGPQQGTPVAVGAPMMSGRAPQGYPTPVGQPMGAPQMAQFQPVTAAPMMAAPVGAGGRGPGGGRDYGNTAAPTQAAPVAMAQPVAQPAPVAAAPQQAQAVAMPTQDTVVDPSTTKWNPSESMPYPIAYNPVTSQMYYQLENGKTIPTLAKSNIDMINYDRHTITTLFGHVPENLPVVKDNGELTRELVQAVAAAKEEAENVDGANERVEEHMGLKAVLNSASLETAIQDVRLEMLYKIDREEPPMVFQAYAQIYTPILGDKIEYDFLRKLADSSSYIELREKIRANGANVNPELLSEVILRTTALMNTILHKQLSILPEDVLVDDFVTDLDALLSLLKNNYSENMQKAFLKDQNVRIKQLFSFPDITTEDGRELHDAAVAVNLDSKWETVEDKPAITFFGYVVRLSFINMLSHDLLIAGLPKISNILTKQQAPALFDLAHQVFSADDNGQYVARQLVITKDGRILEMHEANLVKGGYLVSLVK